MEAAFAKNSDNIGDDLNAWIWQALLGDIEGDDSVVLGIGTLINEEFCRRLDNARKICVMGTGAGYGRLPKIDRRWHFYAVRGRRTAAVLGLDSNKAVADSAYFLASLNWGIPCEPLQENVVVIPHHRSLRYINWDEICRQAGVKFLSPLTSPAVFMRELNSARLVLTEAMHGAIIADLCRIPWQGFSFGGQFNSDKWLDWSEMFAVKHEIITMPRFYDRAYFGASRPMHYHVSRYVKASLGRFRLGRRKWGKTMPPAFFIDKAKEVLANRLAVLSSATGYLSSDNALADRVELLYQRLNQMRRDLGAEPITPLKGDGYKFLDEFAPFSDFASQQDVR